MTEMMTDAPACPDRHRFDAGNPSAERGTRRVVALTAATMVIEIAAGWWTHSMALLADGWHMSTHALALGLTAFAYAFARRHADHPRFAFGTWKVEVLGGYTSALILLGVAAAMFWESGLRLVNPLPIAFDEAIWVAIGGLIVNLVSARLLHGGHEHHHHDHSGHDHAHHPHHDLALRSAYIHVIADAATSVLAIAALAGGKWFGWQWLDALMGIVGGVLVAVWAVGLLRDTGRVLLDAEMDAPLVAEIRRAVEAEGAQVCDLHVWRVGRARYACILGVAGGSAIDVGRLRARLAGHEELVHVTVEVGPG